MQSLVVVKASAQVFSGWYTIVLEIPVAKATLLILQLQGLIHLNVVVNFQASEITAKIFVCVYYIIFASHTGTSRMLLQMNR